MRPSVSRAWLQPLNTKQPALLRMGTGAACRGGGAVLTALGAAPISGPCRRVPLCRVLENIGSEARKGLWSSQSSPSLDTSRAYSGSFLHGCW